ncbi:MAG: peptidyl-prolyl cis-trans isomerase [Candidatus Delongbacteria bacterium]|nr:peptidyl-prolyl cis-trans isomerase [Candidatus Delongbacteria bacterium]
MRKFILLILIMSVAGSYAALDSNLVLTPGYENKVLATIDGKEIKEFDVFGIPSFSKIREKISLQTRIAKIQDHILDVIFQKEGNTPEITNSVDYVKTYNMISKKISVDQFRDDLIDKKFLGKRQIEEYYELNKDKYPEGMKDIAKIKEDLRNSRKREIDSFISHTLDSLKIDKKVEYNEELLRKIAEIRLSEPSVFADSLKSIGLGKVLVSYKDQKKTITDLYAVVRNFKPYHMDNLNNIRVLKSLVDGEILNELLAEIAKSKGYLDDKRVIENSKDKMKYFISSEYKKRLFQVDNFKPTKDELIDYYIEHKDDPELKTRKKMWTFEIFKAYDNSDSIDTNDKIKVALELENIRQKILNGESFEKYAKFYARPSTRDGELGYIYRTDYAMIGETADKLEVNEISELIIQQKAISIVKVTEIKNPQLYKFDYVEEIVKNRVIDQKRDKFKDELKSKLFKKYNVVFLGEQ